MKTLVLFFLIISGCKEAPLALAPLGMCQFDNCTDSSGINTSAPEIQAGYITHLGQTSWPGATQNEWINAMVVDSSKNVYAAGVTKSALNGTAAGGLYDAMVMKFNSSGDVVWVKQLDSAKGFGTTGDDTLRGITLYNNHIYVTGYTKSHFKETLTGTSDMIVVKLDLNGNIVWSKHFGATDFPGKVTLSEECWSATNDGAGGIYLGCYVNSHFADTNANTARWDIVVIKLNENGGVTWSKQFGTAANAASAQITDTSHNDYLVGMKTDSSRNLIIAGYTMGNFKETNAGGAGSRDGLIIKLNSAGDLQWVTHLGDTTLPGTLGAGQDYLFDVDIGSDGKIYFSGYTSGQLGAAAYGSNDIFFGRLSSAGVLDQIKQPSENSAASLDSVKIRLGSDNSIYLTGTTYGTLFGAVTGYSDGFIAKYHFTDGLIWGKQFNNTYTGIDSTGTYGDYLYVLAIDHKDNIYAAGGSAGHFKETANSLNTTADPLLIKLTKDGNDD